MDALRTNMNNNKKDYWKKLQIVMPIITNALNSDDKNKVTRKCII